MKTLADPRIRQFSELVAAGIVAWTKAGQLLCRLTEENPGAHAEIIADNPHLTPEVLVAFERIGRRELHPYLAMDSSPASRALAALPYDEQARLYREKVCVVVNTLDGPVERQKRVCDLTKQEAGRVIGEKGIRTPAEQRKLLRPRRRLITPRGHQSPEAEEPAAAAEDFGAPAKGLNPAAALIHWLGVTQNALLEARSALTLINRRESKQDRHITAALGAVGQLRLAANEDDL